MPVNKNKGACKLEHKTYEGYIDRALDLVAARLRGLRMPILMCLAASEMESSSIMGSADGGEDAVGWWFESADRGEMLWLVTLSSEDAKCWPGGVRVVLGHPWSSTIPRALRRSPAILKCLYLWLSKRSFLFFLCLV